MARTRRSTGMIVAAFLICALIVPAPLVSAFAEENLYFRDPYTGELTDDPVSSIHSDLVYAMALAAGFTDGDAARIMIWDQLVDSEALGAGASATYTNCLGSFGAGPSPSDVCPEGAGAGYVVWPRDYGATCASSRYGPYSPFFHFAHDNDAELGVIREWAWGRAATLPGYGAYAWGGQYATVLNADCRYTQPELVATGITPGSLEAFATYLHSLADAYSHRDCLAALDALGLTDLWGTHTVSPSELAPCRYNPSNPKSSDAHGEEFGSGAGTARTDAANVAVFQELAARSARKEGKYYPIDLDARLTSMSGQPTLRTALTNFVHNWDFEKLGSPGEYPNDRRAYGDRICQAVKAQRKSAPRPKLTKLNPTKAAIAGQAKTYKLTVTGKNFGKDGTVQWNGLDLRTTYKSSTELKATVPSGYIAVPGSAQITVYNKSGGGGSKAKTFTYTEAGGPLLAR